MNDDAELTDPVHYMTTAMSMSQFVKEFGFGEDVFDFVTGDQMATQCRGGSAPRESVVYTDAPRTHVSGVQMHTAVVSGETRDRIQRLQLPWLSSPMSPAVAAGSPHLNLFMHIGELGEYPGVLCTRLRNAFAIITYALTPVECDQLQVAIARYGKVQDGSLRLVFDYAMRFNNSNSSGLSLHETLAFFDVAVGYAERNIASIQELEAFAELTREPLLVQGMIANKSEIRMTLEVYV